MAATLIDGKAIAQTMKTTIANDIADLVKRSGITPTITTITIGTDPASALYLKLREKACAEVGVSSNHLTFPADVSEQKLVQTIQSLNGDATIHGILLQFPLPPHLSAERLITTISPSKDVEGLTPYNMGETLLGTEHLVPCTPLAVVTILEHEHIHVKGTAVTIVNHSTVVGKPLTALLLNRNATVSVCHVYTKNIKPYTSQADILITATGIPGLITADHVKQGAVVIDVGITSTKQGVRGDVNAASVIKKAKALTPVPGGVGPVTIACSLQNMVTTYKNCLEDTAR